MVSFDTFTTWLEIILKNYMSANYAGQKGIIYGEKRENFSEMFWILPIKLASFHKIRNLFNQIFVNSTFAYIKLCLTRTFNRFHCQLWVQNSNTWFNLSNVTSNLLQLRTLGLFVEVLKLVSFLNFIKMQI